MLMQSHTRVAVKSPAEQDAMRLAGRLAADVLDMNLDPKAEFTQIFNEGWRLQRDYLYVPNMFTRSRASLTRFLRSAEGMPCLAALPWNSVD